MRFNRICARTCDSVDLSTVCGDFNCGLKASRFSLSRSRQQQNPIVPSKCKSPILWGCSISLVKSATYESDCAIQYRIPLPYVKGSGYEKTGKDVKSEVRGTPT